MVRFFQVLKDFGVFIVKSYAELSGANDVKIFHEKAMILIALLASLPFWLRVRQCWIQFDGCADNIARIPILLNMIKYMTAFPPIWITGPLTYLSYPLDIRMDGIYNMLVIIYSFEFF